MKWRTAIYWSPSNIARLLFEVTTMTTSTTPTSSTLLTLATSREAVKFIGLDDPMGTSEARLIEVSFRAPARYAACYVPADAWRQMRAAVADASYATLLEAVLDKAAKNILSARIENMSLFPSEIDGSIFSADAILSEAMGNNSEWLSKEELTQAWERSATRKKFTEAAKYASDVNYRKAVNAFADMVLKLAGKTTMYKPEECDKILAKLDASDMDTELGSFVVRRLEMIRNKPQKNAAIDLDLL